MKEKTKKFHSLLSVVLICAGLIVSLYLIALAATSYQLATGVPTTINEWSTCQKVTNSNVKSLFVPTNTSAEWLAFRTYKPADVTLASCANAPSVPQNLVAIAGGSTAVLNWAVPVDDGGSAITNYKVYRGATSGQGVLLTSGGCENLGNVLTCTDTGLTDRQTYYYKVTASNNEAGESLQSNEVSAIMVNIVIADDATVGTRIWQNPGNALISNNVYASNGGNSTAVVYSHYLKATNFVFDVPSSATINGITLQVEGYGIAMYGVNDYQIKLVKGGIIEATNKAAGGLSSTETVKTYGGPGDLWGSSWFPADINNVNFGAVLSYSGRGYSSLPSVNMYIDNIQLLITYTVGGNTYTKTGYGVLASTKEIVGFNISSYIGVIDQINHTIGVTVPYGTSVASLTPTIVLSGGVVNPASGVAQDFTNSVVYTVTAADSSTVDYTVTVTVTPISTAKDITQIFFGSELLNNKGIGYIYGNNIDVVVPGTLDITSAVPNISISAFATINPLSGVAQNFINPVPYIVTAQDSSTKTYKVTTANAPICGNPGTVSSYGSRGAKDIKGYWNFDSNLNDVLTIHNGIGTPTYTAAKVGNGINSGIVSVPTFPNLSSFSVGAWIAVTDCWSNYQIISKYDGGTGWSLNSVGLGASGFNFTFAMNGVTQYTSKAYSCGWHHVSLTRQQGSSIWLYVDGVIDGMNWNGGGDITNFSSLSFFSNSQITIDEAFIYDRIISQVEAEEIYIRSNSYQAPLCRLSNRAITNFSINTSFAKVINEADHTVNVTVLSGTNITSLIPTISISPSAVINPASGVAQNFTSPVTYTVTAADGTSQDYIVTVTPVVDTCGNNIKGTSEVCDGIDLNNQTCVTLLGTGYTGILSCGVSCSFVTASCVAPNTAKQITSFTIGSYPGLINEANKTIKALVPSGTSLISLTPTISVSASASVNPASGVAQDFTNPVVYTVTAQDASTQNYTVTVDNTCGGNIVDSRDSKSYPTVVISTQCWMAKNMNVGTMTAGTNNQGTDCPSAATIEKYCYSNSEAICTTDGGLYQWNQAMCGSTTEGAQGICPTGWHIPSRAEKHILEKYLTDSGQACFDYTSDGYSCIGAGTKLISGGSSGFNAVYAGYRSYLGSFFSRSETAYFWSSLSYGGTYAVQEGLDIYNPTQVYLFNNQGREQGHSIRCIRN